MLKEIVLRNIRCTTTRHGQAHRYAPAEARAYDTLVYAAQGEVLFSEGGSTLTVHEGELLYIPSGVRGVSLFPAAVNRHHVFSFTVCEGTLWGVPHVLCVSDALRTLILECAENRETMRIVCPAYYASCMYRMLYLIDESETPEDDGIRLAIRHVEQNYTREDSVGTLARMACMSESAFRKCFVAAVGMSPVAYRNRLRLLRVEELLAAGATVREAVGQAGFGSVSFYYRLRRRNLQNG